MDFPGGSDGKESACNAGDLGSIPGSGRYAGERNGNPLQYSCLENVMDRGAWQATFHGIAKSQTRLSDYHFPFHFHNYPIEYSLQDGFKENFYIMLWLVRYSKMVF